MKVYLLIFDWATDDASDVQIDAYGNYASAYADYRKTIEDEKNPANSWAGECFTKNGKFKKSCEKDYEFDDDETPELVASESALHWAISDHWGKRSFISLIPKELK